MEENKIKSLKTAEMKLREKLEVEGWLVVHKGWPDFVCVKDDEMIFVEVKNYKGEMLKKEQHYILTNLAKLGLNCFKWTPDVGFERITPSTPLIPLDKQKTRRLTLEEKMARLSPEDRKRIEEDESKGILWYL